MPTIVNDPPALTHAVQLSTQADGPALLVESPAGSLADEDQLFIKHHRPASSDPVRVPISVTAPSGWTLAVEHYDDGVPRPWPNMSPTQCQLTWAETEGDKRVVITATPPASTQQPPKKTTVFIKVRPEPELPV